MSKNFLINKVVTYQCGYIRLVPSMLDHLGKDIELDALRCRRLYWTEMSRKVFAIFDATSFLSIMRTFPVDGCSFRVAEGVYFIFFLLILCN